MCTEEPPRAFRLGETGVSRPGRSPRLIRKQGLDRGLDGAVGLIDNRFTTYLPPEPALGRPAPADVPTFQGMYPHSQLPPPSQNPRPPQS
jgi:hypothetical protein